MYGEHVAMYGAEADHVIELWVSGRRRLLPSSLSTLGRNIFKDVQCIFFPAEQ